MHRRAAKRRTGSALRSPAVAAALIATLLVSTPASIAADVDGPVVERVELDLGTSADGVAFEYERLGELSANGRYATFQARAGDETHYFHLDLETEVATPLAFERDTTPEDNGAFVHVFERDAGLSVVRMTQRQRVGSLDVDPVRPDLVDLGFGDDRRPPTVVDSTSDGRYVLLYSGPLDTSQTRSSYDVWDTQAAALVTPPGGLELLGAPRADEPRFSTDDRHLVYATVDHTPTPVPRTLEVVDLATGTRTSADISVGGIGMRPSISTNGRYAMSDEFISPTEESDLYRTDLSTGERVRVPIAYPDGVDGSGRSAVVFDDGTVFFFLPKSEGGSGVPSSTYLFRWTGPGAEPAWINPGTDGEPTGIRSSQWADDGSRFLFDSVSDTLPRSPGGGQRALYTIDFTAGATAPAPVLPARPTPGEPPNPNGTSIGYSEAPRSDVTPAGVDSVSSFAASRNGRYVRVTSGSSSYHLDLETGVATSIATPGAVGGVPDDSGELIERFGFDPALGVSRVIEREQVATGDIVAVEASTFDLGYGGSWSTPIEVDATNDGRHILLFSSLEGSNARRYVVWNTVAGRAVTPINGFHIPDPWAIFFNVRLDRSGTTVGYTSQCCIGASYSSFEQLDYTDDEQVSIEQPHPFAGLNWHVSENREWMVFLAASFDAASDRDGARRLYRRNVETGLTDVVPYDLGPIVELDDIFVSDRGTVLYVGTTGPDDRARHLAAWSGGAGPGRLLTRGIDGAPADGGIDAYSYSNDGSVVMFTVRSTNLATASAQPAHVDGGAGRLHLLMETATGFEPDPDPDAELGEVAGAAAIDTPAVRCSMSPTC